MIQMILIHRKQFKHVTHPFFVNLQFIQIDLVWTEFYHHELECVKLIFQDHSKNFDSEGRVEPYVTILLSK